MPPEARLGYCRTSSRSLKDPSFNNEVFLFCNPVSIAKGTSFKTAFKCIMSLYFSIFVQSTSSPRKSSKQVEKDLWEHYLRFENYLGTDASFSAELIPRFFLFSSIEIITCLLIDFFFIDFGLSDNLYSEI